MNERLANNKIYLLAKEAGLIEFEQLDWNPELVSPTYESVAKARKFAELIVLKCIEQGKQIQSQSVSNGSEEYNTGREMGIEVFLNQIKKHFGVE